MDENLTMSLLEQLVVPMFSHLAPALPYNHMPPLLTLVVNSTHLLVVQQQRAAWDLGFNRRSTSTAPLHAVNSPRAQCIYTPFFPSLLDCRFVVCLFCLRCSRSAGSETRLRHQKADVWRDDCRCAALRGRFPCRLKHKHMHARAYCPTCTHMH